MNRAFDRLSAWLSAQIGRPAAFLLVCLLSVLWLAAALGTGRADAINNWLGASSGLLSILLLVLLQASQTRDTSAVHLKLDELLRAIPDARNEIIAAEALTAEEIAAEAAALLTLNKEAVT